MLDEPNILIIRRDNIGDLVCTTPLFAALRQHFPKARICVLANSYNRAVLANNPDVDRVFWYSKAKHERGLLKKLQSYWHRLLLIAEMRREGFDYAILATPTFQSHALRFARLAGAKTIVAYPDPSNHTTHHIDLPVRPPASSRMHEVELVYRLLTPLGIHGTPGPLKVQADNATVEATMEKLKAAGWHGLPTIGIHISARKISQRWPASHFIELIRLLHSKYGATFLLLWAPGSENDPQHPGDDEKAALISSSLRGLPIVTYPTLELHQLIAALSLCRTVICSDGGAMHLAAGLGKPIVCLFGRSDSTRWHPWDVSHRLLQPPSHDVQDIMPNDVLHAYESLCETKNSA